MKGIFQKLLLMAFSTNHNKDLKVNKNQGQDSQGVVSIRKKIRQVNDLKHPKV